MDVVPTRSLEVVLQEGSRVGRQDPDGAARRDPTALNENPSTFEPVAIVGVGLRLPGGVHSTEGLWDMLMDKRDGRCEVPETRYNIDGFHHPAKPHSIKTKHGYFLQEDPALFDASFFSIPSLEAERMDPQQRLLMEVVWECLENAGERDWRGKNIGSYVGVFGEDWLELACKDTENLDRYRAIGTGGFALANRVSYEFDFRGPSITIQTGCSASLVGLHEACQALQTGTCSAAVVAGTSLIWGPSMTTTMTDNLVLSPEGICRTFDANANGYGRGEAINAIYIKPLSAAIRDQDPIRAVIRSTATNFDGRTPTITNPCPYSQEALIRSAYLRANIDDILQTALFECHGTATTAGDKVETSVVARLFEGQGTIIGAVKPNVGHSEGASGLTSVIKAVLALEKRTIPPNAHFETPNPDIPFAEGKLVVPVVPTAWPEDRAERVSINCFGIGGSNAHVILDSTSSFLAQPQLHTPLPDEKGPKLLVVSARSTDGLKDQIQKVTDYANNRPSTLQDLAYTLAARRRHLPHRAFAVTQPDHPVDLSAFEQFKASKEPHLTLVFTGQGAQWAGMGRDLMQEETSFRDDIHQLDQALQRLSDRPAWSLEDVLAGPDSDSRFNEAAFSQPLCTALQIALKNLLNRKWGIQPAAVVGHSSGEIAAAYAAGAIDMESAIITAYLRGRVATELEGIGSMAAVAMGRAAITPYLTGGSVVIACENSPKSVTLSGSTEGIHQIVSRIQAEQPDTFCRILRVGIPYHSYAMHQVGDHYESQLAPHLKINRSAGMIPMYSTANSMVVTDPGQLNAAYWRQNLESPVLFSRAVENILATDANVHAFLEIGPHSALRGPLREIFQANKPKQEPIYISTVKRSDKPESQAQLLAAMGAAHTSGINLNLESGIGSGSTLTDIPGRVWKHDNRYWFSTRMVDDWRTRPTPHHELLGGRVTDSSDLEPSWRNLFYMEDVPWLEEHVLGGEVIFPGAGYITMAGEAVQQLHPGAEGYSIQKMVFKTALILKERRQTELITSLKPVKLNDSMNSDWYSFTIVAHDGTSWTSHCHGEVRPQFDHPPAPNTVTPYSRQVNEGKWYQSLRNRRLEYGERFRGLHDISSHPIERVAFARVTDSREGSDSRYSLHPTVIDQCLQAMSVAWANGLSRRLDGMGIPAAIEELYVRGAADKMAVGVKVTENGKGKQVGDATLTDEDGQPLLCIKNGLFISVDDNVLYGDAAIPPASQVRWIPDIDLVSPTSLVRLNPTPENMKEELKDLSLLAQHSILHSAELIKDITPTVPHMVKWKEWLNREAANIRQGVGLFFPEALAFAKMNPEDQKRYSDSKRSRYSKDDHGYTFAHTTDTIYNNCRELATGQVSALDLLMSDGQWQSFYDVYQPYSDWSIFLPLLGQNQPSLRVLEIGAGTGSGTAWALKHLKSPEGVRLYSQYFFTDISPGFMAAAQDRFQDHDNIEYKLLDITKDPKEQGFTPHTFDLIIASNVIHATPSLQQSLRNVYQLLAPQGWFLLHELNPLSPILDFVMGTLPGWWLGEDDGRADRPYVAPERWNEELRKAGFTGNEATAYDFEGELAMVFTMLTRVAPQSDPMGSVVRVGIPDESSDWIKQVASTGAKGEVSKGSQLPKEVTLLITTETPGPWAQEIASLFAGAGHNVTWASWGKTPPAGQCIISLLDLDGPFLYDMDEDRYLALQSLIRQIDGKKLFWVTRASQVEGCDPVPRFGLILGLARTLRMETTIDPVTIEIDRFDLTSAQAVLRIFDKVFDRAIDRPDLDPELEFAVSGETVHVARCHWNSFTDLLPAGIEADVPRRLGVATYGLVDTLHWTEAEQVQALKPHEVEVDIRYVGLNFRDVMVAMGVLGDANELGLEGSGVVRRVGSAVEAFKPGDEVAMVARGMFRTRAVLPQDQCQKVSNEHGTIDLQGAATMPSVYITAFWVFVYLARLRKGQTVLIHSACGGVGLASIRICQELEANIYVTVGSEEKAQYLMENHGIPRSHIFNSRDASFLPDLMRETNGRGADIVLNSLAGKLLHASWECVAEFGKMFELGKRDFLTHGTLGMTPFLKNRAFFGVDMLHLNDADPSIFEELQSQYTEWRDNDKIGPINPVHVFEASEIVDAFRYMQTGTHMGKILVKMPESPADLPCSGGEADVDFSPAHSYMLIGGLGGLGKSISRWMVERGARSLVYLSRSAGASEDDQAFFQDLQAQGCSTVAVVGSVNNPVDVGHAISKCEKPLAGVLQMSMVLRDRMFAEMSYKEWTEGTSTKIQGTWNLHEALKDLKLDFFVVFGSLVGMTGNQGQANYAASNTFVDTFTRYRRHLGLPSSTLHLGVVEEVGMVSEHPSLLQRARDASIYLLREKEVISGLAVAICQSPISPHSTTSLSRVLVGLGNTKPTSEPLVRTLWGPDARFSLYKNLEVRGETNVLAKNISIKTLVARIEADPSILDTPEIGAELATELGKQVTEHMLSASDMDEEQAADMAIDSLMAIEIKSGVRRNFGVEVSLIDITKAGTIRGLADLLLVHLKAKYQGVEEIGGEHGDEEKAE